MLDVPLLIGGRSCPSRDERTFERRNPVTGEVVSRVAAATLEDADAAVAAAQAAFPAWAALAPNERRTRLLKAAAEMRRSASTASSNERRPASSTRRVGFECSAM